MGNGSSGVSTTKLDCVPSGSVLLIRLQTKTHLGTLDSSIIRGIASAQRGGIYMDQGQSLPTWTHCALILERKGKRYIVQASPSAILLLPAARHLQKLRSLGARVAVRCLAGPITEEMRSTLTSLLHTAATGCEWGKYMPRTAPFVHATLRDTEPFGNSTCTGAVLLPRQIMRLPKAAVTSLVDPSGPISKATGGICLNSVQKIHPESGTSARDSDSLSCTLNSSRQSCTMSDHSDGASSEQSADLPPFARKLIRMLIPRVYGSLQALPPRLAFELLRAFAIVDQDGDGR